MALSGTRFARIRAIHPLAYARGILGVGVKYKNIARDPRLTMLIYDRGNPYRYLQTQGKASDITKENAHDFIDKSDPISTIYSGRVARDFLGFARRDEKAVQVYCDEEQRSKTRKYPQPEGIRPISPVAVSLQARSTSSTPRFGSLPQTKLASIAAEDIVDMGSSGRYTGNAKYKYDPERKEDRVIISIEPIRYSSVGFA